MKQFLCSAIILGAFIIFSCETKGKKEIIQTTIGKDSARALTEIKFDSQTFDFGTISQGEIVEHTYIFTNIGKNDLEIEEVQASCGCTTPDYTKEIVKPGEKGKVVVKFNSTGREGHQSKTVNVYANTNPDVNRLHFSAEVVLQKK